MRLPYSTCATYEVNAPRELLNQDTFYRGTLKAVGKVYVQVVVDVFCLLAFVVSNLVPRSGSSMSMHLKNYVFSLIY